MFTHPASPLSRLPILALAALAASQTVVVTVGPSIPSQAPEFVDQATFTSAILNSTNVYRAEHNASDVRWNQTLQDYASDYLDSTCDFKHSGGPYGENLAIGCANATSCVEAWGDEGDDYNYRDGKFSEKTGHFTQLVWKDTTDVGCGQKLCGDDGWYLVCEYWPRGNVIGDFDQEVDKPENTAVSVRPTCSTLVIMAVAFWILS
ncbi:Uu.00g036230.m01.CDS01 [Anthostomella pinea]|uniref:Uu.00g036230.m01.CDS01 n=1 Tax=Anthostomella pinea TaxID=933095 RepID=A0AAI8VAD5_9PEZI|nr:Uu.00g036230.m01.CDS01 [Anthostomella pinea]